MRSFTTLLAALGLCVAASAFAQDSDQDGTPDVADSAPCDGAVSAWAFAPAEDVTGTLLFEDQWPVLNDEDFNDLVLSYNYRVALDAQGKALAVTATFEALAVGGNYTNSLNLHLPVPAGAAQSITVQVGSSPAVTVQPSSLDAELTFTVIQNLRSLFGGQSGPINVSGNPIPSLQITVTINLSATPLAMTEAPFDVFLARAADPSHQVHRSAYGGTAAMNQGLFGTGDDASAPGRNFVDFRNLPFVLDLPASVAYPQEGVSIAALFPNIVNFAASGGATDADYYQSQVVSTAGYANGNAPVSPGAVATDYSCLPASCLTAQSNGSSIDGSYLIVPGGLAPLEVYCNMTDHGGGWTLYTSQLSGVGLGSASILAPGSNGYLPAPYAQALAVGGSQVYLRTSNNPARYILSTPNTTPIVQLRNLRTLSANPSGHNSAHWSGPMLAQMAFSCGSQQNYPYVYWACNNSYGLHFNPSYAKWVYVGGTEAMEAWVR